MSYLDGRWRRQSLVHFGSPQDSSVNVAGGASLSRRIFQFASKSITLAPSLADFLAVCGHYCQIFGRGERL